MPIRLTGSQSAATGAAVVPSESLIMKKDVDGSFECPASTKIVQRDAPSTFSRLGMVIAIDAGGFTSSHIP
jgi:hypothetical protein